MKSALVRTLLVLSLGMGLAGCLNPNVPRLPIEEEGEVPGDSTPGGGEGQGNGFLAPVGG